MLRRWKQENTMLKRLCKSVILATTILLGACVAAQQPIESAASSSRIQDIKIVGKAGYRERIAVHSGSTFKVQLLDISLADAPSVTVAEVSRTLSGEQSPFAFELSVKDDRLKTNMRYAVRATINDLNGALLWTTDRVYSIEPKQPEQDLGLLELVKVGR
jgi:putative lipoprotein